MRAIARAGIRFCGAQPARRVRLDMSGDASGLVLAMVSDIEKTGERRRIRHGGGLSMVTCRYPGRLLRLDRRFAAN